MTIMVVGLGLIGGSLCKTIKKNTDHVCIGWDIDQKTQKEALECGAVDKISDDLSDADITFISLYPQATLNFISHNAGKFKKGSLVMDCCGVKQAICKKAEAELSKYDVCFLGAHPMAGREFSGFSYATDDLYDGASFIITPTSNTEERYIKTAEELAEKLGFGRTVVADPEEHDDIIAYTSQLAHVVSSAYIKSSSSSKEMGFSAGSFKDLTRVAKLNEDMWTSLFLLNSKPLIREIDEIILHLSEYRNAVADNDEEKLKELLKDGRIKKETIERIK